MPLEQIRPVAALNSSESLRRQSYFDSPQASSSNHLPFSRDDAGSDSDRENAEEHDDVPYYDRFKRHSTSSVRSDPMSLAKLGGVGGVTRSGSWGRNSLPDTSSSSRQPLRAHHSMLARYQEEDDDDDDEHKDHAVSASDNAHQRSPDRGHSLLSRSNDSSKPIEAPASSRTSTASSAAAFSLRSLSDRNSTGSASSLASSVVSPSSDSEHLTSTPPAESTSVRVKSASGTAWTGPSQSPSPSATAPSSPAHNHAADAAEIAEARATDQEDISDSTSQGTADAATPSVDCVGAAEDQPTQPIDPTHTPGDASNRAISSSTPALLQSPIPSGTKDQRVDSPLSNAGLSLNAVEVLSSSVTNAYSPLIPRKHSGAIMLRSRSQLALHPGLSMTFANADGGRAAARERARKNTGWENAPFSVLEAQRHARAAAFSQPASPGSTAAAAPVAWDASAPAFVLQPAARVTEQANTTSLQSSPRPSQRPASTSQTPPPLSLPNRSVDSGETSRRPSLVRRQKSEHSLSRAALARLDTVLGLQANDRLESSQFSSADAATLSMPIGVRNLHSRSPSGSAVVGANGLLRTPTTEEWSRYLESQGVGLAGRRSRTGTNRSTSSRFALTGLQSSARSDIDAVAGDYDDDSDADSDDSDSHDLGAEVLEKLKQLGLSRAASRAGSVLGDELTSLHEEDEDDFSPVSPQTDRILPHTDLEPLTPLASDKMALSQIQGGPLANLHGSPSTPQAAVDRGITVRLPRSKRPTLLNEAHNSLQLYPHEHNANKSIADFEIVSDIGRGAYGLVKKARMKGLDGRPQGEEVIIKYIIKSRILADCWRRHRVLGPIPVEIHVMDQLRRIAYVAPTKPRPWSPNRPKTLEEYRTRKRLEAEREEAPAQPEAAAPAAASSALTSHPNICRMLDFFEDHEFYYLVMPCFGRGQDLFDYVESAPDGLAASQCRSIFGQVADALWFLHANNIVHRDIKDENVILDGEGNAQLIDFGSAAHVRPGKLFDTFSGTLDYAAAEILQGEKYAGQAQDVWALGVVGFVLLCGECPFWNGEEAVQGVEEGTRAAQTLKERCLIARGGPADPEQALEDKDVELTPLDPAWSPRKDKEGADPDGGGRVDDFVDLISRCLELDPESRPSAEQICQHRFLAGFAGWTGRLGWQRLKASIVPSCTIASEGKGSTIIPAVATAAL